MNRLPLFPDTTTFENETLTIDGQGLDSLAEEYGTPLYLYDSATLDNAVKTYKSVLATSYSGRAAITYAGKAYLNTAIAQWTQRRNLWLDCTGDGEIAIAKAGNVPRDRLLVHGVNKSETDLKASMQHAGTLVIDNLSELQRFRTLLDSEGSVEPIQIWLRLQPGLAIHTHTYTQTGQHNSKFGMESEELMEAVSFCREKNLPLTGLHFHLGSQYRDPAPLKPAIELALHLAWKIGFSGKWHFSPGGGWGVAYHEDDLPHPEIEPYIRLITETIINTCQQLELDLPCLHLEPGRSLIARAGVAVYRVDTVKRQGGRTWLLINGGMADNPRHALYGTRYSALPVEGANRECNETFTIGGPYCESGDVLIETLLLPDIQKGDLIAVPMSGAYQLSMSSNYNGARRPVVVWLENGRSQIIQRREISEDLIRRDFGLMF